MLRCFGILSTLALSNAPKCNFLKMLYSVDTFKTADHMQMGKLEIQM